MNQGIDGIHGTRGTSIHGIQIFMVSWNPTSIISVHKKIKHYSNSNHSAWTWVSFPQHKSTIGAAFGCGQTTGDFLKISPCYRVLPLAQQLHLKSPRLSSHSTRVSALTVPPTLCHRRSNPLQRFHPNQWNPKSHHSQWKTQTFLLTLTSVSCTSSISMTP